MEPKRYLDGVKDCADGSDEPCPATQFACRTGGQCVPQNVFQDGVRYVENFRNDKIKCYVYVLNLGTVRMEATKVKQPAFQTFLSDIIFFIQNFERIRLLSDFLIQ